MAIVTSTVGPGKDYSTLAAWWAAKSSGTDVPQAMCYSGSDLGPLSITTSGSFTTTEAEPLKIYAAPNNRHDGVTPNTGAYAAVSSAFAAGILISGDIDYWHIDGIAVDAGANTFGIVGVGTVLGTTESCLVVGPAAGTQATCGLGLATSFNFARNFGCKVFNNIVRNCGQGIGIVLGASAGSITRRFWEVYNNTVKDSSGDGIAWTFAGSTSTPTINFRISNNIVMDCTDDYDELSSASSRTAHASNITEGHYGNFASDTSTSEFPVSVSGGSYANRSASDLFTNASSNILTLKQGSEAINAGHLTDGEPAFGFDYDLRKQRRKEAFDCGAFEFVPQPDVFQTRQSARRLADASGLLGD
tara:strand:- start:854 stop:1933 length:1080 start_codon:yes stop_codon:yes gene_type:complete